MKYKVGVCASMLIRHALRGDFGDEASPHEHTYKLEWTFTTEGLDANGFALDIAALEEVLAGVTDRYGGVMLNDLPFFRVLQPSLENCARFLLGELLAALDLRGFERSAVRGVTLRIWENDSAWASCAGRPVEFTSGGREAGRAV